MGNLPLQQLRGQRAEDLVLTVPEKHTLPVKSDSGARQRNPSVTLTGSNSPSTTCPPTTPSSTGAASPEGSPCSRNESLTRVSDRVVELASLVLDRSHAAILAGPSNASAPAASDL